MIVDASVGVKWLVPEPDRDLALQLLVRLDLAAPDLFKLEIGNLLGKRRRQGVILAQFAKDAWAELDELPVRQQLSADLVDSAFDLSLQVGAAIYDCVYLAMADATDDVLVTADERFARAVRQSAGRTLAARVRMLSETTL